MRQKRPESESSRWRRPGRESNSCLKLKLVLAWVSYSRILMGHKSNGRDGGKDGGAVCLAHRKNRTDGVKNNSNGAPRLYNKGDESMPVCHRYFGYGFEVHELEVAASGGGRTVQETQSGWAKFRHQRKEDTRKFSSHVEQEGDNFEKINVLLDAVVGTFEKETGIVKSREGLQHFVEKIRVLHTGSAHPMAVYKHDATYGATMKPQKELTLKPPALIELTAAEYSVKVQMASEVESFFGGDNKIGLIEQVFSLAGIKERVEQKNQASNLLNEVERLKCLVETMLLPRHWFCIRGEALRLNGVMDATICQPILPAYDKELFLRANFRFLELILHTVTKVFSEITSYVLEKCQFNK
ncbi:hypothetical protein SELMODRAFT_415267 [Selaginella moellendorffii]|uniref:Uncharacterized protein n=1 Tax=Selaginella moellendorffii TaxID=88036 RepID=D8RVJ9_SELML|nr:hypothetical protein SELMODRAFT_415267 [Selaginella moellendorffii]